MKIKDAGALDHLAGGLLIAALKERVTELELELRRSLEATDIAVNGARSATFELSRVKVLHADALLGWAAERARAEKLREALYVSRREMGPIFGRQLSFDEILKVIDEALAATEVKP